jgi:hypothetical protein
MAMVNASGDERPAGQRSMDSSSRLFGNPHFRAGRIGKYPASIVKESDTITCSHATAGIAIVSIWALRITPSFGAH